MVRVIAVRFMTSSFTGRILIIHSKHHNDVTQRSWRVKLPETRMLFNTLFNQHINAITGSSLARWNPPAAKCEVGFFN